MQAALAMTASTGARTTPRTIPSNLHPDAALLQLGAELDASFAAEKAMWATVIEWTDEREEEADRLGDRSEAIVDRIAQLPAQMLDGLRSKTRAIAWCCAGEPFEPCLGDTTEVRVACSIVSDLMAM